MSNKEELSVMMKRLNNLANSVKNAADPGMKQIWTDKWYSLVKEYGRKIQSDNNYRENVKVNERLNG